jgi:hypothetical protein
MGPDRLRFPFQINCVTLKLAIFDFQITYCVDRKGAGYDFDTEPEPEHAVEIITLRSASRRESSVSL